MSATGGSEEQSLSEMSEYQAVLLLEELESLLEDIEEQADGPLPAHLMAELGEYGLGDVKGLRLRIAELHARLDTEEG